MFVGESLVRNGRKIGIANCSWPLPYRQLSSVRGITGIEVELGNPTLPADREETTSTRLKVIRAHLCNVVYQEGMAQENPQWPGELARIGNTSAQSGS